jgi:hypothetical protein
MAQSTLVESQIGEGLELIDQLVRCGFPVAAAWWVKPIEDDDWKLFLASAVVDDQGPAVAYQQANDALRDWQEYHLGPISLGMASIIGEKNSIAREIFKIVALHGGGPPIYVNRYRLGETDSEGLHIFYVTKLPAPWHQVRIKNPVDNVEELSTQQKRARMVEIGASGRVPNPAEWSGSTVHAGTVVNARILHAEADSILLIKLPDGRQGFTPQSNTEQV